jgi:hypothetical protein
MKTVIATAIALSAVLSATDTADAQAWLPSGSVNFNGNLVIVKGQATACPVSGSLLLNGSSATITIQCNQGPNFFLAGPYKVTVNSSNSITLNDVRVVSLLGECSGDLAATFNQNNGTINFANAPLPSVNPSYPPCQIFGQLITTPAASYTVP